MRLFLPNENQFIADIVKYKKEGNVYELAVDRLLKNNLTFFALKWQTAPEASVKIYSEQNNAAEDEQTYFKIADFIYFVQELEQLGFVKLQNINKSESNSEHGLLYDRDLYRYISEDEGFSSLQHEGQKLVFNNQIWTVARSHISTDVITYNLDFAFDLERYASSIIYPLPVAEDYVAHKCKTLEKRQYDKQMKIAYASLKEAKNSSKFAMWAAIISGLSIIASIILARCDSHIDDKQIQEIIKAIEAPVMVAEPSQTIIGNTIVVHNADTKIKKMGNQIQQQK